MLQLNESKMECLIVCSPNVRNLIKREIGEACISPKLGARNLSVYFDAHLDLERHLLNLCKSAYHHLENISAFRRALTRDAAETLIHSFKTSHLDFCNSLLAGLPSTTPSRLQAVQNAAARLLTGTLKI